MSIYRKAVNNPVTTALVFVALALFGVYSLINISIDRFPKFDANVILVMSSYPGASAEDIENNLSKLLENSLNGVSDLKNITSNSKENISIVALEFNEGVDIDVATNDVRDKLDAVNSQLPDGASMPMIFKFSLDEMPIMIMAATEYSDARILPACLPSGKSWTTRLQHLLLGCPEWVQYLLPVLPRGKSRYIATLISWRLMA